MTQQNLPRRIASVLLVVLVVTSGASAPVAASHDETGKCDKLDILVFGFSFGHLNKHCTVSAQIDAEVHAVQEAESNQTKLDLYEAQLAQNANEETSWAMFDNYLADTESIAWMEAEAAIAESYENGESEAQAQAAARQAIADYYAVKQINLIESWNNSATSFKYIDERAAQEGFPGYAHFDHKSRINNIEYNKTTMTLANSSTHDSLELSLTYHDDDNNGQTETSVFHVASGYGKPICTNWDSTNDYCYGSSRIKKAQVDPPNSNFPDPAIAYTFEEYKNRWNAIDAKNDALQTEADAFVNATYSDYEAGLINSSDVLSRTNQMFNYGTFNASTETDMWTFVAATAGMGLDTPELNRTGMMAVSVGQNQYYGMVMAREAPNGSWEAGKTYDPANITGPVFMVTDTGHQIDLTAPFTIDRIETTDGESISNVSTTNYVYKTSNTSDLLSQMDTILALTQQIEDLQRDPTSGGSGGSGGLFDFELFGVDGTIVVVAGAAAALLLLDRKNERQY